ncbi:MAG: homoserine dehydrogenase [Planctomycetota bacterium]|nr:MAG: homoserine dehydrogenase [Planctomycetota bacterium]
MLRTVLVGLGHVGRAVLRGWERVPPELRLVGAADSRGRFCDEAGLDPRELLSRKAAGDYDSPAERPTWQWIAELEPELLIELTVTDLQSGEPAVPDMLAAFAAGAHVVTSAKSHQRSRAELQRCEAAARAAGRLFLDHAAHLAGVPVTEMMAGVGMRVTMLEGVLNGTTNYLLQRLEDGVGFEQAVAEAVARGYAERDWRYDVEGTDVGLKLVGLARRLMGGAVLDLEEIRFEGLGPGRRGIDGVTPELVAALRAQGKRLKLFGEVRLEGGDGAPALAARVYPRTLPLADPFARVAGFRNAIAIHGELNGTRMDLFLAGPGAGADQTASRVIGNLRHLVELLRL